MSMTREEAINWFDAFMLDYHDPMDVPDDLPYEVAEVALAALCGPTREMVERMRGEWETPGYYDDGGRFVHDCSKCGVPSNDEYPFCPACGAPMTDKAVDMMLERWKEAVDGEQT